MHFSLEDFLYKWLPHFFCLPREGGSRGQAGWWLKVISISTIARKLCAGACTLFKNSTSIKMHTLNSGSRSMCLQIFKDFKSNVDFWKVMKIILQKEKKQISVISAFFGTWPSDITKLVPRPSFIWWQRKKMMTLLLVFPSSNVWNLYLYL